MYYSKIILVAILATGISAFVKRDKPVDFAEQAKQAIDTASSNLKALSANLTSQFDTEAIKKALSKVSDDLKSGVQRVVNTDDKQLNEVKVQVTQATDRLLEESKSIINTINQGVQDGKIADFFKGIVNEITTTVEKFTTTPDKASG